MKNRTKCLILVAALMCCSCNVIDVYVEADKLTYRAIAPEYERYVDADVMLSSAQRARRKRTLSSWRQRIAMAEGK